MPVTFGSMMFSKPPSTKAFRGSKIQMNFMNNNGQGKEWYLDAGTAYRGAPGVGNNMPQAKTEESAEGNYKNMKEKIAATLKKSREIPGDRNSLGGPTNKYWYEKIDHWWEQ